VCADLPGCPLKPTCPFDPICPVLEVVASTREEVGRGAGGGRVQG